jgi:hypothetical protein
VEGRRLDGELCVPTERAAGPFQLREIDRLIIGETVGFPIAKPSGRGDRSDAPRGTRFILLSALAKPYGEVLTSSGDAAPGPEPP